MNYWALTIISICQFVGTWTTYTSSGRQALIEQVPDGHALIRNARPTYTLSGGQVVQWPGIPRVAQTRPTGFSKFF